MGPEGRRNAPHPDRDYQPEGGSTHEFLKNSGIRVLGKDVLRIVGEISRECIKDKVCVTVRERVHVKVKGAAYAWLDRNWAAISDRFAIKISLL
jgi:hypothetical protein